MDRKQFDKLIDYAKLKGSTSVINEAKYQLFYDENEPFVDVQTIDEKLVRKSNSENKSVEIEGAKPLLMITESQNDICFGRLLAEMRRPPIKNKVNRMWYRINVCDSRITDDMVSKWIQLGTDSKIIPDSFEITYIKRENPKKEYYALTVINNVRKMSPPIFYLGAAFLRCLREKPNVVVGGLHLMEEVGIDPYIAFAFLHKYCVTGSGHMPLSIEASYGHEVCNNSIEELKIDAGLIIGLRRLIFSHKDESTMTNSHRFNCASTITSLRPHEIARINVNIYETMEPEFMKIMESEPGSKDEDAAIKRFANKKGNPNARQNYCART